MRKLGLVVACLLLVLLAAILVGPSFIDWTDHKQALAREASRLSGRVVTVDGAMDLALLPRPRLRAEKVTLSGLEGARARHLLTVETVDLRLHVEALLRGRIEVESLQLDAPVITLEVLDDGRRNWDFDLRAGADAAKGATEGLGLIERIAVERVTMIGGELRYLTGGREANIKITKAELRAKAARGAWQVLGGGSWRGAEGEVQLSLSAPRPEGGRHLALEIRLPGMSTTGSFSGRMTPGRDWPGFSGELEVSGGDLAGLAALLAGGEMDEPAASPVPVAISGALEWNEETRRIEGMELTLGDVRLQGSYERPPGEGGPARMTLNADRFDLERLTPEGDDAPALLALAKLGGVEAMQLELGLRTIPYRGRLVRDLILGAALTEDRVEIQALRATLPGGAELQVVGALDLAGEGPRFRGQAGLTADNLRALLAWLELDPGGIAPRRLRRALVGADLEWTPDGLNLPRIEGTVDVSTLNGALAVAFRKPTAFGLRLEIDRLDADAYLAPWLSAASADGQTKGETGVGDPGAADWLGGVDANLDLDVGELKAGDLSLKRVRNDAELRRGDVRLRQASVGDLFGAALAYEGALDLTGAAPALKGNVTLDVPDPRAFSRALDMLPPLIERLGPFSVSGIVGGDVQDLHLEGLLREEGGEIAFSGDLRPEQDEAAFSVDLGYRHTGDLLRLLGAAGGLEELRDPVELTAFVRRQGAQFTINDIEGRVAETTLAGRVVFEDGTDRPSWEAKVRLGDVPASSVLALLMLDGADELRTDGLGANWSRQRFDWPRGLTAADGRLSLSADSLHWPGGRVAGLQIFAVVEERAIRVEKISGRIADGTVLLTGMAAGEPAPDGRVAVTAIGADPGALVGTLPGLGLPSGGLTFNMRLSGAGDSVEDLVGNMNGRGELRGRVSFADANPTELEAVIEDLLGEAVRRVGAFARAMETIDGAFLEGESEIVGSFEVSDGILDMADMRLVGQGALLRAKSRIDLPRWRLETLFELIEIEGPEGALLEVGLTGPIDQPNVRLRGRALSVSGDAP